MAFRIKGTRSKTRKAYVLAKHRKYSDTVPERKFATILETLGAAYLKQVEIKTPSYEHKFTVDFLVYAVYNEPGHFKRLFDPPCVVEVQGIYHYKSKRQINKTRWRTKCLTDAGYSVLLVDYEFLDREDIVLVVMDAFERIEPRSSLELSERPVLSAS